MKNIAGIITVFALAIAINGAVVAPAHAETSTSNISSLMETVKSLLAKVAELQKELAKVRGEIKDTNADIKEAIKDGLKEGMTDEDVKKIQELLAADKEIYPEGKVTGYFGQLTKEALKRFQTKHNIKVTGELDEETKDLIEEYFGERANGKFPQGIFHAPGIQKKIQERFCERKGPSFRGWFCKGWDWNDEDEDDDDDCIGPWLTARCHNDDDDDDDEEVDFKVTVTVDRGDTTVTFTEDGEVHTVELDNTTSIGRVLTEVADELDTSVRKLDKDLVDQIKEALKKAVEESDDVTDDQAEDHIMEVQDMIDDVQEDIDDADEDVDTDDAQEKLDDAQEKLDEAQEEFDKDDYNDADKLADDAEDLAEEAADLLEDAIEDAD
jgi:hypothetical protein